jgi:hypothetical protein
MFLLRLRRRPTLPFRPSSGLRSMESEKGLCPSWIASILPSSACLPRHRVNVGLTWMLRQQSWPPPNRRPSCRCWLRPTSPHRRLDPCVLVTPWSRDPGLSSRAEASQGNTAPPCGILQPDVTPSDLTQPKLQIQSTQVKIQIQFAQLASIWVNCEFGFSQSG